MQIGEAIRFLREEKKMTQQELAAKLGKSRAAIGKYETGVRLPEKDTMNAICDFFCVSTDFLMGRSEYRNALSLEQCLSPESDATFKGRLLTAKEKEVFLSVIETVYCNLCGSEE